MFGSSHSLAGRRVLITGGARGIGAALAERLHARGAHVALVGLEPERLAQVAARCGDAPWREADVADREQMTAATDAVVAELGGLDAVVANAGIAKQLPTIGGDPKVLEQQLRVNVVGVYVTLQAAGPHISHPGGYALVVGSLAGALAVPVVGAYSASKAAAEVLANTFRGEVMHTGARVGVAYFSEIRTDMTDRGFETAAAGTITLMTPTKVQPIGVAVNALERALARRSRHAFGPLWVAPLVYLRMFGQPFVDRMFQSRIRDALRYAQEEQVPLSTEQPTDRELGAR